MLGKFISGYPHFPEPDKFEENEILPKVSWCYSPSYMFNGTVYPDFLSGCGYLIPAHAVNCLYQVISVKNCCMSLFSNDGVKPRFVKPKQTQISRIAFNQTQTWFFFSSNKLKLLKMNSNYFKLLDQLKSSLIKLPQKHESELWVHAF